ncbi:MAG: hypothetical protein HYY90_04590 [Candidatus Omnitrophica bacterium]|nr:hypothetical protein [Candidatus Omnitrophota bacterium]MBI3083623.1 hypothetical protein [Candidatus Omnitrophota bacterium]
MKRIDAYLKDETYAVLKAEAKRRNISISALGREIVCAKLGIVDEGQRKKTRSSKS